MANINFPNNPVQDDIFTVGGKTYTYDGVKWVANTTITKTDVGLENVQNYGVATQAEAESGSLDNKYMTPLKTAQAIAELGSAAQIFTLTILNTDWVQAQSGDWTGNYLAVMTLNGLLNTDVPFIDLDFTDLNTTTANSVVTEFGKIFAYQTSNDNEITLYANDQVNEVIKLHIMVVR